jgi:hypothetical protein
MLARKLSENVSVSITYSSSWENCTSNEEWSMAQLTQAATEDGLSAIPEILQKRWRFKLRKENNSFRGIFYELDVDTPELPGLPT